MISSHLNSYEYGENNELYMDDEWLWNGSFIIVDLLLFHKADQLRPVERNKQSLNTWGQDNVYEPICEIY